MYACGFRIYFTPLPGFFSPFPHGTGSLSVDIEYLALEDGPPIFRQDFSCPALLVRLPSSTNQTSNTGLSPSLAGLSIPFSYPLAKLSQALPISLAATLGISVDFFSCGYLDVSVLRVRFPNLCIQLKMTINGRVSPFRDLRINARLPAPRSFSQATTSFIA